MGIFDKDTFDNIKQNEDVRWFFGLKKKPEPVESTPIELTPEEQAEYERKNEEYWSKHRSKQGGLADIMEVLKQDFFPEPIKDEYDLESQLVIFLKLKFPDRTIRRKFRTEKNNEVDIMIDQLYGLELKVPKNSTQLRNLGGQVEEYQEEYEMAIIIYEDESLNISETIQEYVKNYKKKYDIDTIVYPGKIRK